MHLGVYVVANSFGEVFDFNGKCLSNPGIDLQGLVDIVSDSENPVIKGGLGDSNTTVGAVITNAVLTNQQASYIAQSANFGFASRIYPYSTGYDGDTVFAVSSNSAKCPLDELAFMARVAAETAVISIFR